MGTMSERSGVILFGHGARDARWAEPFERLAVMLRGERAARGDPAPVSLAFLELMTPSLEEAIAAQAADGCTRVVVVPVFFGQGGHLRRDLPMLLERTRHAHPGLRIECTGAVGEDEAVLQAIARFCVGALEA
jgi:sirohydrochlorin cobaltochelatase